MHIYPAIDLRGGKVVRLEQGRPDAETTYGTDPVAVAASFAAAGAKYLHMVDLDGAFTGNFKNLELVAAVARSSPAAISSSGRPGRAAPAKAAAATSRFAIRSAPRAVPGLSGRRCRA